jgi:hypothetical protein
VVMVTAYGQSCKTLFSAIELPVLSGCDTEVSLT